MDIGASILEGMMRNCGAVVLASLVGLIIIYISMRTRISRRCRPTCSSGFIKYLDGVERSYACMHDRGNFLLHYSLMVTSHEQLSLEVLKVASTKWIQKHRMLRARIQTDGSFYRDASFVEMHPRDLVNVPVHEISTDDWKKLHEDMLLQKIDCVKGPLWRLSFVPHAGPSFDLETDSSNLPESNMPQSRNQHSNEFKSVLMFGFLHCLTDGIAAVNIIGDFIEILNGTLNDESFTVEELPLYDDIHAYVGKPSLVELCGMWLLSLPFMSRILDKITRRINLVEQSDCPKLGVGVTGESKLRIHTILLEGKDVNELLNSCRHYKCTVQGALEAAVGVAMTTVMTGSIWEKDTFTVHINVPVDLRRHLRDKTIPPLSIGNYFGDLRHVLTFQTDMSKDLLVKTAQDISNRIRVEISDVDKIVHHFSQGPSALIDRSVASWDAIADKIHISGRNSNGVQLSNLGLCPCLDDKGGKVVPMALYWSMTWQKVAPVIGLYCATLGGRMALTILSERNIVSESQAHQVTLTIKMALQQFREQ